MSYLGVFAKESSTSLKMLDNIDFDIISTKCTAKNDDYY